MGRSGSISDSGKNLTCKAGLHLDWHSLPSLGALRAFAALAETGSFARAGAALNVSHAAVSQRVRALEETLGVALLDRQGRSAVLTPEGLQLAAALDAAFQDIRRAVDDLTDIDASRPLQITTTPAFAVSWLMPASPNSGMSTPKCN